MTASFRIEAELWERFRAAAAEEERTMGAQLRFLIHTYLDRKAAGDRRSR